jgi:hypothetical protein
MYYSIRYIPPIDTPCYKNINNLLRYNLQGPSTLPNLMATNPKCPFSVCNSCSNINCPCNLNHMNAPFLHRYFVYKWNQY